jgi:predicted N-acetyltransferase YhbS
MGIGRTLLAMAEERAIKEGYTQMAVISGIGVRGYYQKNGYELQGTYMMKPLTMAVVEPKADAKADYSMMMDVTWDAIFLLVLWALVMFGGDAGGAWTRGAEIAFGRA